MNIFRYSGLSRQLSNIFLNQVSDAEELWKDDRSTLGEHSQLLFRFSTYRNKFICCIGKGHHGLWAALVNTILDACRSCIFWAGGLSLATIFLPFATLRSVFDRVGLTWINIVWRHTFVETRWQGRRCHEGHIDDAAYSIAIAWRLLNFRSRLAHVFAVAWIKARMSWRTRYIHYRAG